MGYDKNIIKLHKSLHLCISYAKKTLYEKLFN